MAITKYILSEARLNNPINTIENYTKKRKEIYQKLKNNNKPEDFFNNENFNKLKKQYEILSKLPEELKNTRVTSSTKGILFNGEESDEKIIKNLINKAKSLQDIESFNDYTKIFNELEKTNVFIQKDIREKINSNNIFSISTRDYELMKNAILTAEKNNDLQAAKKAAKVYYSGLIGNLGETIGIIQGYNLVSKEMQKQLKSLGININVSNTGAKVEGKRAVGDTTVSFIAKDGQVIGSISMSNKLTANYSGKPKSTGVKLRTTRPSQISDFSQRSLYYNLFSLHGEGENKKLELYPNKNKEIIAFRRYIAAIIMKESLFGAFSGDNVYYFNYGEYLYTMNDLLDYWIYEGTATSGIPLASLPGHKKRIDIMKGVKSEEDADKKIAAQDLIITYSFHIGNINKALGL